MSKRTFKNASIPALTGLLALTFVGAGAAKLVGVEQVILPFERMGLPVFAKITGLLEIAGAIALFLPRLRFLAALGLSATMVGAVAYHLTLDPEKAALPGVILLILCGLLAWSHRPHPIETVES